MARPPGAIFIARPGSASPAGDPEKGLIPGKDASRLKNMNKQKKAIADLGANILGNIAVVGAGLALYEQKWWCIIIALCSTIIAGVITWRSNK